MILTEFEVDQDCPGEDCEAGIIYNTEGLPDFPGFWECDACRGKGYQTLIGCPGCKETIDVTGVDSIDGMACECDWVFRHEPSGFMPDGDLTPPF